MEVLMAIVIGALFATGLYMMLRRSLLRLVIGLCIMSHAANLLIFVMGRLKKRAIPVLEQSGTTFTDPLVQALILTAIVISFGVIAFFLVLVYRTHEEGGSDDVDDLRRLKG